jgi:methyl-accepting chemotaxis protein
MFTWVRQFLAAPVVDGNDEIRTTGLLNVMLLTILVATVVGTVVMVVLEPAEFVFNLVFGAIIVGLVFWLRFLVRRGRSQTVSVLLSSALWLSFTILVYMGNGIRDQSVTGYFLIIAIASVLLGGWGTIIFGLLSVLTLVGMLYAEISGAIDTAFAASAGVVELVTVVIILTLTAMLLRFAMRRLGEVLERSRRNERSMAENNRELANRTAHLERLATQLKSAAQVGRASLSLYDPDVLLSQVTELISELFDFYHFGIFLLDEDGEYAVLRASNSEGGRQMLSNGHRLKVGEQGVVGHVTATGEPHIALDVGSDAVHFRNPLLPETRSEMALPLKVGERVIGALDVQSRQITAYDDDDVMVFQMMADQLAITFENARLLDATQQTVRDLSSSVAEILAATTQQASGASEQSAAIAQTTTTVDELKTIAEQSVSRAQEVAGASRRTVEVSRTGRQAVQDTIGSMGQIKARVEGIAENILALSEQTQQIGEIIATVNGIAAQSNMLALNASVEAARAGEYGKGFAVVAVEVRNLAEQSRQATGQVKAILSDIQRATNATVMATEEGTKRVEEGAELAGQAGAAIEELGMVIEESAQAAAQMVAGGRQQSAGVEQVAVAMQSINQATAQSLASTRQAEKAARDLNDLARSLSEIVKQYKL